MNWSSIRTEPENLYFQNGKMIIEAKPEGYRSKNYTSSKILTQGKRLSNSAYRYPRDPAKERGIWPRLADAGEKCIWRMAQEWRDRSDRVVGREPV